MSTSPLRIEMRCILYSDVVDSTLESVQARQRGRDAAFNEQLRRFMTLWRESLPAGETSLFKPLGDGLLATFSDPLAALKAAVHSRRALEADPLCCTLLIRIGLHVGTVSVQPDGDILGADAALGERVMRAAEGDQIVVSEAYATLVKPYLPLGHSLHDLGEQALKGFDTPIRLYRLEAPGLRKPVSPPVPTSEPLPDRKIRVMLVEDETLLRQTLARLLQLEPDYELVGQAPDGERAVAEAATNAPDVILMDVQMPRMDGIEATRRIKEALPDTEVVILTKFGDDDTVFGALRAGTIGYLLKDAGLDEMRAAIHAAHHKEGWLSPALVARVVREFSNLSQVNRENRALFAQLSRREVEILELLGTGVRNRAIAEQLYLSEKTVKNHVTNILAKLQVNGRTEAALLARSHGLTR